VKGSDRERMVFGFWAMLLAVAGAALAAALGGSPSSGEAAQSRTFTPVADAHVRSTTPNENFGTSTSLRADGEPRTVSYLRFDLSGSGPVTSAKLRLLSEHEALGTGVAVSKVADNSWSESGITYANAPPLGGAVTSNGPFLQGQWITLDVSSAVNGNTPVTLALTTTSSSSRWLASRESQARPELVVTLASTPTTTTTTTPTTTPSTTTTTPTTTTPTTTTPTTTTPPPNQGGQPGFPIRAAFYYPWFAEAWNQRGIYPYTKFSPSLGFYRTTDPATVDKHIRSLEYGGVEAVISSWWGQGTKEDARFPLLLSETKRLGSALRWAPYYEEESLGDPTSAKLANDLAYIKSRYASDPAYLRVGGRPVIFAFSTGSDGCGMVDRWKAANAGNDFYIVLKVFSGYRTCANQPASWHQYAPAKAADRQAGYSYAISPGFNKADELTARLVRDLARFRQNVRDMVASGEPWQLVTTFNEWGEGTAVESASRWASASGQGTYLDALHSNGGTSGP
jgi:hypothetical protein